MDEIPGGVEATQPATVGARQVPDVDVGSCCERRTQALVNRQRRLVLDSSMGLGTGAWRSAPGCRRPWIGRWPPS